MGFEPTTSTLARLHSSHWVIPAQIRSKERYKLYQKDFSSSSKFLFLSQNRIKALFYSKIKGNNIFAYLFFFIDYMF